MASKAPTHASELSTAILQHVGLGTYPEPDVASADIPASALPGLLEAIDKTRDSVKEDLRNLSRQSASHLDGWIFQAKQLQLDIEKSKATAREIVNEAEAGKSLRAHQEDASSKVELLKRELDYNVTLGHVIEQLQAVMRLLDAAQHLTSRRALLEALKKLSEARRFTTQLDIFENARFAGLVQRREARIRELLGSKVVECWAALIKADASEGQVVINTQLDDSTFSMSLEEVTAAMLELGILDTYVSRLHRDLDTVIINPLFTVDAKGMAPKAVYEKSTVQISGMSEVSNPSTFVQEVDGLVRFITRELPERLHQSLLEKLLPSLMVQLVNNSLDLSVPVQLDQMADFKSSLVKIEDLADYIDTLGIAIPSEGDLSLWLDRLPQTWLARRREAALARMRSISHDGAGTKRIAERVETQTVSSDDVMITDGQVRGNDQGDEWNADWAEDDEIDDAALVDNLQPADDNEDASAWGLEEEGPVIEQIDNKPAVTEANVEGEDEAWGWGDGEDEEQTEFPEPATLVRLAPKSIVKTSVSKRQLPTDREITLRETFAITAIPDSILELINLILVDASTLSADSFPIHAISTAAPALSSLPTLFMAFYRATARTSYASQPAADMLIYNDSQHLAGSLGTLLSQLSPDHPLYKRLTRSLEAEIKLLYTYSRLAYGREMDSQRTILSDLLSATSGFDNCTSPLNKREYDGAVEDVVHRVRELNKIWTGVLSDSARLQSLGAILSHVIRRITTEILELSDGINGISEEESKTLKYWMDQVSALSDLFEQDPSGASADDEVRRSVVHVYTPGWLRFIYLGEILEASLVDIKFLWNEGELSLEFEANEVEDLIKALFAESQYRRDALKEIKSSGRQTRM
ncbi:hypothetical protein FKW77_000331 [Venturia effusa]|uniref:ZW10 C-terminal helical domain-containing protein n=1 Tax=Venturia effusa TaxID=50376 RepID=A0A517KVM5_9PEZI|nr:hypothetical protein FKW77_000331 [Venturia effusa]